MIKTKHAARVHIRMTEQERRILDELAEREHTTVSGLVRRWLWTAHSDRRQNEE